jgi:hypothetical protein
LQITVQLNAMVHRKVKDGRGVRWKLIGNNAQSDAGNSD